MVLFPRGKYRRVTECFYVSKAKSSEGRHTQNYPLLFIESKLFFVQLAKDDKEKEKGHKIRLSFREHCKSNFHIKINVYSISMLIFLMYCKT